MATAARGQENAVSFEPVTDCYPAWWEYGEVAAGMALVYIHWKCVCGLVRWCGDRGGWWMRVVWPSGMALLEALLQMAAWLHRPWLEIPALVLAPVAYPVFPVAWMVEDCGWVSRAAAPAAVWLGSFALVRVAEWRGELRAAVELRIGLTR
jgi:hypothetical protein